MGIARKTQIISDKDKLVTAYHEGGHALTSILTKGSTPLHKVTILPRGDALGFVMIYYEIMIFIDIYGSRKRSIIIINKKKLFIND